MIFEVRAIYYVWAFLFPLTLFTDTIYFFESLTGDQLSVVRTLFSPVGKGIKKVPFSFTIKLPKPRIERVITERDKKGRIVYSKPPKVREK